jgi:hypothetical protein
MNEDQIKRQAERDAIDQYQGYQVWCPYDIRDSRADIWKKAFSTKLAELILQDKR